MGAGTGDHSMNDVQASGASGYPQEVIDLLGDRSLFGRMTDSSSAASLKGPCGDEMEFYLNVENGIITEITYFTQGCSATRACAAMTACLARGRTLPEALSISANEVARRLEGLPESRLHCSILAVSTLYRAVAGYLLKA
jgi:nitrogen fixation NifU-like protein